MHSSQCKSGVDTLYPSLSSNEREALLAFVLTPGLSSKKARELIAHYPSIRAALEACTRGELLPIALPAASHAFFQSGQVSEYCARELKLADRLHTDLIPYYAPQFPEKLKTLADCPLILYCKGTLPAKEQPCAAIIGTRNATEWGKECAYLFAKTLAGLGASIVSGLARGIDTAAHRGALLTGSTLAIIGSGIADIYPRENSALAEEIAAKGAVISELPMQTPPTRFSFPKRNRLICAFADALLVAEAPLKSGSMLTMSMGYEQKKRLFALPGRALQEVYEGNHHLIQSGKAELAHHPDQIAHALHLRQTPRATEKGVLPPLLPDEQKILDFLSRSELSLDQLSYATALPVSHLQSTLMQLMLKALIKELPGKRYIKK
ncbi:MAG: DNA-protecting protein DprA [Verrucomicrobia bacterium]|nr:DNA-protecting protein DprA [Verrucomicrobiota bacterium]